MMTEAETGEMRHAWSPQELGEVGSGPLPGTSGGSMAPPCLDPSPAKLPLDFWPL